jgi:hypothetical protein
MTIADKMLAIHAALGRGAIPHAFGGALALAWCTQMARGTNDLDINIFLPPADASVGVSALPDEVERSDADLDVIRRDGQVRLFWGDNPIDLFFATTEFHDEAATRVRWEPIAGTELPFLSCRDLAVFKAFFNRRRDWADLEEMHRAGTLDAETVLGVLVHYLGGDDERVAALRALVAQA